MSAPAISIKEYKRNYWEALDKVYWGVFLAVFIVEFVLLTYLQSLPVREVTEEDYLAFQRRVFTTLAPPEPEPAPEVTFADETAEGAGEAGEETDEEAPAVEAPIEQQQETIVSRQQRRSEQQAARTERQAAAQQAAAQTGLFAAVGGDYDDSGGSSGAEGLVDTDVRSTGAVDVDQVGSIYTGSEGDAIREIRGGLQAGEGEGSGVAMDFGSMSASELRQLASVGGVTVGEVIGGGTGGGATSTARSEKSLLARLIDYQKGIQTCYERNKRRKRDLTGSIELYWSILPDGSVTKISIVGSWNDAALGKRVESCIKRKVETWQFEEVAASTGEYPTGFRFLFEE